MSLRKYITKTLERKNKTSIKKINTNNRSALNRLIHANCMTLAR